MIKRFWCWLWGHDVCREVYAGFYERQHKFYDNCPRCGVKLK